MSDIKRIGIITSGGDCCGLNGVIEGIVRGAYKLGYEVYGFKMGYDGLYNNDYMELTPENTYNIFIQGGSIIGNSNKTNLFNLRKVDKDGNISYVDVSDVAVENLKKDNITALIIVGGDGSMTSARDLMRKGVNVFCVPKTIDNDVPYTDRSFGYSTALSQIIHALNSIRTTGLSHNRVMVLEVMGRHAGWLALEGGLGGNADVILIPEIPYDIEKVAKYVIEKYNEGKKSVVICVSEGAIEKGGEVVAVINKAYPDSVKLGGIGTKVAYDIENIIKPITSQEVRCTNLGYIQRGGETDCFDRILSLRYGSYAIEAVERKEFGKMVALKGDTLVTVPIISVVGDGPTGETSKGGAKIVDKSSDVLRTAKAIGIYFGE